MNTNHQFAKIDQFATHVYSCLVKYDAQDVTRQVQEDEKLAILLTAQEEAQRKHEPDPRETPSKTKYSDSDDVPRCPDGQLCSRTNEAHFRAFVHPPEHPLAVATPENHPGWY